MTCRIQSFLTLPLLRSEYVYLFTNLIGYPNYTPTQKSICNHAAQFSGPDQHDSQEFLTFLLDGLHEDLNRVISKPNNESSPEREAELEKLPQQIASEQEWEIYRMRNDSLIVDYFQGQFRNRMECLTCHHVSDDGTLTSRALSYSRVPRFRLQRPTIHLCIYPCRYPPSRVPQRFPCTRVWTHLSRRRYLRNQKHGTRIAPTLQRSHPLTRLRHCPKCKALRSATKILSLSRLPPVLLIHLKRFSVKGPFTDKIETVVDFPLKSLNLTNYMPPPLPPDMRKNAEKPTPASAASDPRVQVPPYKYDLYGVTNHFGSLSNGHCKCLVPSFGISYSVRLMGS